MKNLKRGKRVKEQDKRRECIFMSMGLPVNIVRGINRKITGWNG